MEKPRKYLLYYSHTHSFRVIILSLTLTFYTRVTRVLLPWFLILNSDSFSALLPHDLKQMDICIAKASQNVYIAAKAGKISICITKKWKKNCKEHKPTMAIKLNEMGKFILLEKSNKIIKILECVTENRAWKVLSSLMCSHLFRVCSDEELNWDERPFIIVSDKENIEIIYFLNIYYIFHLKRSLFIFYDAAWDMSQNNTEYKKVWKKSFWISYFVVISLSGNAKGCNSKFQHNNTSYPKSAKLFLHDFPFESRELLRRFVGS